MKFSSYFSDNGIWELYQQQSKLNYFEAAITGPLRVEEFYPDIFPL